MMTAVAQRQIRREEDDAHHDKEASEVLERGKLVPRGLDFARVRVRYPDGMEHEGQRVWKVGWMHDRRRYRLSDERSRAQQRSVRHFCAATVVCKIRMDSGGDEQGRRKELRRNH